MEFDKPKFSTGGIRRKYKDFHPLLTYWIARALAIDSKKPFLAIAKDGRRTCEPLFHSASSAIMSAGCDSVDLGIAPTPVVSHYTKKNSCSGIMVTASHNPLSYVGMKFFIDGLEESQKVEKLLGGKKQVGWEKIGSSRRIDYLRTYTRDLAGHVKLRNKHEVFLDCGGLSCSLYAPAAMRELHQDFECTNSSINSPERDLEPKESNLGNTLRMIKNNQIGLAFDGDGDRCRVILHKKVLEEEEQILLMAHHVLRSSRKGGKGATIVSTVESSTSLKRMVESMGSKLMITRVGSNHVAKEIIKHSAIWGAEPCGEYVFPEFHCGADGLFTAAKFLEVMEKNKQQEILDEFNCYHVAREKIAVKDKEGTMESIGKNPGKITGIAAREIESTNLEDGIRIDLKSNRGFVLLRMSGTEEAVRITVEQQEKDSAKQLCKSIKERLLSISQEHL